MLQIRMCNWLGLAERKPLGTKLGQLEDSELVTKRGVEDVDKLSSRLGTRLGILLGTCLGFVEGETLGTKLG